ncbi:MAG: hypothetical protein ACLSA6_15850 [Holdemania massiliensis]
MLWISAGYRGQSDRKKRTISSDFIPICVRRFAVDMGRWKVLPNIWCMMEVGIINNISTGLALDMECV